jgi:hypothetical protein
MLILSAQIKMGAGDASGIAATILNNWKDIETNAKKIYD